MYDENMYVLLWFMFLIMVCMCCYGLCLLLLSVFVAMVYACYCGLHLLSETYHVFVILVLSFSIDWF
jgi:hypothetical protein